MLPLGKLKIDFLERILPDTGRNPRVIVGARVGEDAAVIDFGDTCLVAKTDPNHVCNRRNRLVSGMRQ